MHGANVACPDPIDNPPYPNASELEAPPVEQLGGLVRCTTVTRTYAGAGSWHVQEMQLATSDLGSFLVALHAPSTRPSGACGHGSPYTVPWFTLVTLDGSVLQPTVPFDGCIAAAAVLEAFDHLRWRTIAAVRYSP
ncbi:MAG: hypothetical protein QOK14_1329 [Frankiaceae bacterium]|nr:hypothetical protein [Frankiaceae bacterium]